MPQAKNLFCSLSSLSLPFFLPLCLSLAVFSCSPFHFPAGLDMQSGACHGNGHGTGAGHCLLAGCEDVILGRCLRLHLLALLHTDNEAIVRRRRQFALGHTLIARRQRVHNAQHIVLWVDLEEIKSCMLESDLERFSGASLTCGRAPLPARLPASSMGPAQMQTPMRCVT